MKIKWYNTSNMGTGTPREGSVLFSYGYCDKLPQT